MKKFLNDTKGAITVFVSLLLIPAILVSGTAVDLSRIYSARSIVQDANQLAANSVLTQYDAMLQDIYGLYGVMEDDPILGDMLNEYIQMAVFGDDSTDKSLGTFQLFYGADAQTTVVPASGKNLKNMDVLRRQIEEYAKFRAPVIIVDEIWERIEKFKKLKADSEVIKNKIAVDEKIGEIDQIYKEIYTLINDANRYPKSVETGISDINSNLTKLKESFKELEKVRDKWTSAKDDNNPFVQEEAEETYEEVKQKVISLVKGEGADIGLEKTISNSQELSGKYEETMKALIEKCEEADSKRVELAQLVKDLKSKIDSKHCSEELVDGLTKPRPGATDSIIEEYEALVSYELKNMPKVMETKNNAYMQQATAIFNDVAYGTPGQMPLMSIQKIGEFPGDKFGYNNIVAARNMSEIDTETLGKLAGASNYTYTKPQGFKLFQDKVFNPTNNKKFYDVLSGMYTGAGAGNKSEANGKMAELRKVAQKALKIATLEPDGAKFYAEDTGLDDGGLQDQGDWGDEKQANENITKALDTNIISKLGGILDAAGNKLLLLTYDTEMFSNFTTPSPGGTEPSVKTMSGVTMSPDVNYFFQSELEYLYHGNEKSARSNLAAVSGLIFLVRFVFNYTSTFLIDEIEYELWLISSPAGPGAPAVREIARLAYALAESAIDMATLLGGPTSGVPLFKTKIDQWNFSLHSGVGDVLESIPATLEGIVAKQQKKSEGGVYYIDYLRILLLFKDGETLAERTADLIQWNITNVKESCGADEGKMTGATLFEMSKLHTDFTVESTVDLRMLFLSMPFAQNGINGIIPQKSIPITVTDYRGY